MRFALFFSAAALVLVPAASGIESTIYPGVGIGKVRLGMTKAQAERMLGRNPLQNAQEGAYTEFAWDFATWTVGFEHGRAVQIATTLASQRTKQGIGVGTTWRALMRAYPGGRCTWNIQGTPSIPRAFWPEYLVGRRGGSQTLYVFKPVVNGATPVVDEVVVRTNFRPLREFQPNWFRCTRDWRHARIPPVRAP